MSRSSWLGLIAVVVFAIVIYAAVIVPGSGTGVPGGISQLALPAMVMDVNEQGQMSLFGMDMAQVAPMLGMAPVQLPADVVKQMTAAGVQNIELVQTGNGVVAFANGKAMPQIEWTDDSLARATNLAAAFGQNLQQVIDALNTARRFGVHVAIRFPRGGAAEIPLVGANPPAAAPAEAPAKGQNPIIVKANVQYDDRGVASIFGVTMQDLAALGVNVPLSLTPETIKGLQAKNIQALELSIKPSGLSAYLNNDPLPKLLWNKESATNAADLYTKLAQPPVPGEWITQGTPIIAASDMNVMMHFPLADGQQPVKAEMHEQ